MTFFYSKVTCVGHVFFSVGNCRAVGLPEAWDLTIQMVMSSSVQMVIIRL